MHVLSLKWIVVIGVIFLASAVLAQYPVISGRPVLINDVPVMVIPAWFKYFHFPDGTQIVADMENDHAYITNNSQDCFRVSGDELTDSIKFALNPACIEEWAQNLPIYQGGVKNGLSFLDDNHVHDFDFWCTYSGVCEMALTNKYGYRAVISQDNKDLAFGTNSGYITLFNKEYGLNLPEHPPEIGQCLKVTSFIPNRTYITTWEDC